jgi:hypothetical protein
MKGDYDAQAKRVCTWFGYETVYEYGKSEVSCHITFGHEERPMHIDEQGELKSEPFITLL